MGGWSPKEARDPGGHIVSAGDRGQVFFPFDEALYSGAISSGLSLLSFYSGAHQTV